MLIVSACVSSETPIRPFGLLANMSGFVGGSGGTEARRIGGLDGTETTGSVRRFGTGEFLGGTRGPIVEIDDEGAITLNLVGVPIRQAAQAVLDEALGRNYTIAPGVEGTVTLQTTRPLGRNALLTTFRTVLELSGATLRDDGEAIAVVPLGVGPRRIARAGTPGGATAQVVALPLRFLGAAEMARLLEPIAGPTLSVLPSPERGVLLISGTRAEIDAAIEAVNLFDVDVLRGKSVGIFRLDAAPPDAVAEELRTVFGASEGGSLEGAISFIPSERLNAILVVTSQPDYLRRAESFIRDLDRTAGRAARRPVVYRLQSRTASDLAPVIEATLARQAATVEGAPPADGPSIVADDVKNALVVVGDDEEQARVARLVRALDDSPTQVLIEAVIAEVSLTDDLRFGLRYALGGSDVRGTLTNASDGSAGATFPGAALVLRDGATPRAALNTLASVTDVEVISSPSLLVIDNQEAQLQIGDEVPIAVQQAANVEGGGTAIVNTIEFRNTGVILTVRPRVSPTGQVLLDIEQEVSGVQSTTTSGIDSPTISQRRVATSVAVSDGQTIALGGLIEERRNRGESGLPGLRRAPLIGALFRDRSDAIGKTELLILITPRVMRDAHEARAVTEELRHRLNQANGIVRGGVAVPSTAHRILR